MKEERACTWHVDTGKLANVKGKNWREGMAHLAEAMAGLSAAMASLLNARESTRTSASSIGLLINT